MTKEEHIKYWVDAAAKDWGTIQNMYKCKEYLPALFFCHLQLEKLCKALWVKSNEDNIPPKIHNLVRLLNEANVSYSQDQLDFMIIMNNFQLEGRYPDYLNNIYRNYQQKNTETIIEQVKTFSEWLQQQL